MRIFINGYEHSKDKKSIYSHVLQQANAFCGQAQSRFVAVTSFSYKKSAIPTGVAAFSSTEMFVILPRKTIYEIAPDRSLIDFITTQNGMSTTNNIYYIN